MRTSRTEQSSWQKFISIVTIIVSTAFLAIIMVGCSDSGSTSASTAPATVSSTAVDSGSTTVSWATVAEATAYNLYCSTTPDFTPSAANLVASTAGTSYTSTGMDYLKTYYYKVTAIFNHGEGQPSASAESKLPPIPPQSVTITGGSTSVKLEWSDVPGATSYNIYKDTASGVSKAKNKGKFEKAVMPHFDTDVTSGTFYYYVVTAVGAGGESIESQEVAAIPASPLPGAPLNLSATLTPEVTASVTLTWTEPISGTAPTAYNVYRSTSTPVALVNPTRFNPILPSSLLQYVDSGLVGGTTYYYVVTALADDGTGTGTLAESAPSAEVSATPRGSRGGGETDTGFGNNLSFPVIFADSYGVGGLPITGTWTLDPKAVDFNTGARPLATEASLATITTMPYFNPTSMYTLNGVTYYTQASDNLWQAEWATAVPGSPVPVTAAWGDSLSSRTLGTNSVARVEVVLTTEVVTPMTAYTMKSLLGTRDTEVTGTDGTTYVTTTPRVYAINATLKIEKLDGPGGLPVYTFLDKAVYEKFGVDGQNSGMAGEISVSGNLSYGYNWMINTMTLPSTVSKAGWWRLTFYLRDGYDFGGAMRANNTVITAASNGILVDPATVAIEVNIGDGTSTGGSKGGSGTGSGTH
ncbi:MAG: hypothetical protein IPQ16_14090 [Geobacteraceae bacterium]|nr:hypothetical protein [Geobacteraceae bacterium]